MVLGPSYEACALQVKKLALPATLGLINAHEELLPPCRANFGHQLEFRAFSQTSESFKEQIRKKLSEIKLHRSLMPLQTPDNNT